MVAGKKPGLFLSCLKDLYLPAKSWVILYVFLWYTFPARSLLLSTGPGGTFCSTGYRFRRYPVSPLGGRRHPAGRPGNVPALQTLPDITFNLRCKISPGLHSIPLFFGIITSVTSGSPSLPGYPRRRTGSPGMHLHCSRDPGVII